MNAPDPRRRPRTLALGLVETLGERIRAGRFTIGDKLPTEAAIMAEFGVSRTVVREAISKLQAAGLVETRHGIGTFVLGPGEAAPLHISPEQVATLADVIAVLELRMAVETEAAALAARRRGDANLAAMRTALDEFDAAIEAGRDAVGPDFRFHLEIARATQNRHFVELMATLGDMIIPRARLEAAQGRAAGSPPEPAAERRAYLRRVNLEHEGILDAIAARDADAARAAMRTHIASARERRRRASVRPDAPGERPGAGRADGKAPD